jgi:mono/diheme cytochrome c family protein
MFSRWRVMVLVLGSLAACDRSSQSRRDAAFNRAEAAANAFAQTLRGRLQSAMAQGGPVNAVTVCSEQAPTIAREVAQQHNVRIGRATLRTRNQANAGPEWVQQWLRAQGERPAEGLQPQRSVEAGAARVLRPLAVEGVCVACHGERESMAPALREALSARYPSDRAVGYRVGDLRGVLWVEADVDR